MDSDKKTLIGACACFLIIWGFGLANSAYVLENQKDLKEGNFALATKDNSYFS